MELNIILLLFQRIFVPPTPVSTPDCVGPWDLISTVTVLMDGPGLGVI